MNEETMLNFESPEAAIAFAIEREQEAYDFYIDWSKKLENEAIQQVFREFAVEELRHRDLLTGVKEGKRKLEADPKVHDLKITDYFSRAQPSEDMKYQDALQLAIQREKGSIELYRRLADASGQETLVSLFESLVGEETKHKVRLETIYDDAFLQEG